MGERKIQAKSKLELLGKAEAQWNIEGWTGSLQHAVRSTAECFVNIPTGNEANDKIQLRFYLAPFKCYREPTNKFCKEKNRTVLLSTDCNCSTCQQIPFQSIANVPAELCPGSAIRSSGYLLLMDVLDCPVDKLTLAVSGEKFNGRNVFNKDKHLLFLEPDSPRKAIPVVHNFWWMLMWTEGESGKVENLVHFNEDKTKDATLQLKVEAFAMTSTGTEVPAQSEEEKLTETPAITIPKLGDETSDVTIKCSDGAMLRAHKNVLIGKGEYFRRELETKSELSTAFECEPILLLLNWMYTNTLSPKLAKAHLDKICAAAKEFELGSEFKQCLEANLMEFFDPQAVFTFLRAVEQYNLKTPPGTLQKINCIIRQVISGDYGEDEDLEDVWKRLGNKWAFEDKWNSYTEIAKSVGHPNIEFESTSQEEKPASANMTIYSKLRYPKTYTFNSVKIKNEPKPVDKPSDVLLKSSDGMLISAHKKTLIEKSGYFRHNLPEEQLTELSVPVDGEPLLLLLHWMYKSKLPANLGEENLDRLCIIAQKLEIDPEFWKWLGDNLANYMSKEVHNLARIANQFNLATSADFREKLDYIQKKIGKKSKWNDSWEHWQLWESLERTLAEVNFLTVEFGTKAAESSSSIAPVECASNVTLTTSEATSTESLAKETGNVPDSPAENQTVQTSSKTTSKPSNESDALDSQFEFVEKEAPVLNRSEEIAKLNAQLANLKERIDNFKLSKRN